MPEYTRIRTEQRKRELFVFLLTIILLVLGVVFDLCIRFLKLSFIPVDELPSFSMALLQIQGTVVTLAFAVIAFISGNNSDTYLGISVTHYYLEERPVFLTQKRITIIGIIILAIGIVAQILSGYNTVIYGSFSQLALIILAVVDIYQAFEDKHSQHEEFEKYYKYVMKTGSKEKILSMVQNLVDEWLSIKDISQTETERYQQFFILGENALNDGHEVKNISAFKELFSKSGSKSSKG